MVSILNTFITISALLLAVLCVAGYTTTHHGDTDSSIHVTEIAPKPSSECTDGAHKCTASKFQVCIESEWSGTMSLSKNMTCTKGAFANTMKPVNSTHVNLHRKCLDDQHYCTDSVFRVCVDSKWSREMDMVSGMSCKSGVFTSGGTSRMYRPASKVAAGAGALALLLIHYLL
ncbi:hypothetical protein LPJ59_001900 [Coemansia sp. RSA 2399]|nr:hypothetical protein LPJ59_001900 [Coemansia sp. RSA 2399]KAJ1906324.1 hypothetical protein LPJ81_001409 [Coemansia sp. IMI 209127]